LLELTREILSQVCFNTTNLCIELPPSRGRRHLTTTIEERGDDEAKEAKDAVAKAARAVLNTGKAKVALQNANPKRPKVNLEKMFPAKRASGICEGLRLRLCSLD
jgi:hypothetical protein